MYNCISQTYSFHFYLLSGHFGSLATYRTPSNHISMSTLITWFFSPLCRHIPVSHSPGERTSGRGNPGAYKWHCLSTL